MIRMKRTIRAVAVWLVIALIPLPAAADEDVVIMRNGDRLTGELKSLERGKLRFDTSATGTIPIEWDEVDFLSSGQNVQVETEAGVRYLGHLQRASDKQQVIVVTDEGPISLDASHVVLMTPIEEKGIERLDVDVTAGYSFAKASEVQQFHLGVDADFRTETRIFGLTMDAVTSDSADTEASQRQSLDLEYTRLWPNRWLTGGVVRLDRNGRPPVRLHR